jgi:hypothetical protein
LSTRQIGWIKHGGREGSSTATNIGEEDKPAG